MSVHVNNGRRNRYVPTHPDDGTPCYEQSNPRVYVKKWLQRLIDTNTDHRSGSWSELFRYARHHGIKL